MKKKSKVELDAENIQVRAFYTDDDGRRTPSQWFKIVDFDPVNGMTQFDWVDGSYLCFDDIAWEDLEWEYRIIKEVE